MVARDHNFTDFDPAWDFEEATKHITEKAGRFCPFMRWEHWRAMHEEVQSGYESGNAAALLIALRDCACFDLPMPDWVARAYMNNFTKWVWFDAETLDDAFGVRRKNGFNAIRARRHDDLAADISAAVRKAQAEGIPIDQQFFDCIAPGLLTTGGTAKRLYYAKGNRWRLKGKLPSPTVEKLLKKYAKDSSQKPRKH